MAFVFKKYSPSDGSGGSGIIDVTELPAEYKDVDVYIKPDASTYMTFLQLFQSEGLNPDITYYVVDELPTEGKVTNFAVVEALTEAHVYIANNIPYLYGDLGDGTNRWQTVSGMMTLILETPFTDNGFTSDITAETEKGVYVTYKEGEKPVEGVYRLTTETEPALWIISDGQKMNYGKTLEAQGATIVWHIVEALPDTMEPVNMESMVLHLYVLNGTGIGYLSEDGTSVLTFGQMLFSQEGLDKGWATDIDSIDATLAENMGVYIVPAETFITYNVYSDGVWTDYIEGEPVRNEIEGLNAEVQILRAENATLEAENATLEAENATVAEKTASANFTEYAVLEGSTDGVAITDITDTAIECITISNSVTSIGQEAFEDCTGLTSITIPDSVTSIGQEAFRSCTKLTSITIPDSVTSIGDFAFFGCYSLTSMTIPDSVTSIGEAVVISCTKLESATIGNGITNIPSRMFSGCERLVSVIIPPSVGNIDMSAFVNCKNLPTVTIPDSVISIGKWAFYGCAGLTSIIYNGTKAQWKAITFGEEWNNGTPDYIITCTDGTIAKDGTET